MAFFISMFRKNNFNVFESYVKDPIFDTGAIVQFRSNIGVDAVIQESKWSGGTSYYGASTHIMHELKKKTLMVLGESPPLGGKIYASAYSHKEKQGGSRLYRVLPIGDTKVYIVVEKFLKKCRTKAVKDAKEVILRKVIYSDTTKVCPSMVMWMGVLVLYWLQSMSLGNTKYK